jgi:hypothetical protein
MMAATSANVSVKNQMLPAKLPPVLRQMLAA